MTRFVFTAIGIPIGFAWMGLPGAVLAIALNDLPYYAVSHWGLWREGLSAFGQDAKATLFFLATLTGLLALRVALGFGLPLG